MVLDVEPVISEDGRSVDLTITPEFTEFVGFVNYGSPIYNVMTGLGGIGFSKTELTPNIITQPIFSTKKVVTGVKVYDGATVVLGGLVSDQGIILDDHVPVIGELPLVGKLFQSKVKQRRTKNMIMFVTVKVVDPSGSRVNRQ
jgi:general secretion pathway protein D